MWPLLGLSQAEVSVSVMKKLGGIVPRCLRKIMKRTIQILRSLFCEKLTTIRQVGKMAWDCRSMSQQGGLFWSRPPRGLGGFSVIALEHFSTAPQSDINSSSLPCPRHAVFHSFLSDDIKQDAATTTSHSKRLISLLDSCA